MALLHTLLIITILVTFSTNVISKIVLPRKLRYLENMLNAEVVAKAAKIRQRMEANPNIPENGKTWPMILAAYQKDDPKNLAFAYNNLYKKRMP